MHKDHYFPWHFDGNEFTLSILVQKAAKGGLFEYVTRPKKLKMKNLMRLKKFLRGSRDKVKVIRPSGRVIFKYLKEDFLCIE